MCTRTACLFIQLHHPQEGSKRARGYKSMDLTARETQKNKMIGCMNGQSAVKAQQRSIQFDPCVAQRSGPIRNPINQHSGPQQTATIGCIWTTDRPVGQFLNRSAVYALPMVPN